MEHFDAIVIGGGTAGMTAARRLAGAGKKVALLEREKIGGDCLYSGCVPSKAMIHSAWFSHRLKDLAAIGLEGGPVRPDFSRVLAAKDLSIQMAGEADTPEALGKQGIQVIPGDASFVSPFKLRVASKGQNLDYEARQFFIATGSRPTIPPIPGLREAGFLTNLDVFHGLNSLPESLIVLGAGPIGIELAQVFSRLGSKVTVVEVTDCVLPHDDKETTCLLQNYLKAEGITFHIETRLTAVEKEGVRKVCTLDHKGQVFKIEADALLVATGRTPNIDTLNLEAAGVRFTKRGIEVNDQLQTSARHIYALGDVVGPYLFTYVSEYHGHIAAHNALTLMPWSKKKVDYSVIPWATFSDPELAHVGITEQEAHKKYGVNAVHASRAWFKDLDRGKIERETKGYVKVVGLRNSGQLLGAHILGPRAGDLIHFFTLAMRKKVRIGELTEAVNFTYPTFAEAMRWACVSWVNTRAKKLKN
jgi:pyruvate/2-oxoglutarate dehydrogenase complex dihydrolipoamide dehydrogenase (E3) component